MKKGIIALAALLAAVPVSAHDYSINVNIDAQTISLLDAGDVILSSDCTTGNAGTHDTPTGEYWISYKTEGAVLSGSDYCVTVDYWMSFCGGIGIHDASWRDCFGGDIYQGSGSHGCVNVPAWMAAELYSLCDVGTPVFVY